MAVSSHKWTTRSRSKSSTTTNKQAWRNELPNGTLAVKCVSKERSKRQVPDGEDCHIEKVDKKDGTFEQLKKCSPKYRNEPVNDDWCTYKLRTLEGEGHGRRSRAPGMTLVWPDAPPRRHAWRDARREAQWRADDDATRSSSRVGERATSATRTWKKYTDGQKVKLEVRARSGEIVCSSL